MKTEQMNESAETKRTEHTQGPWKVSAPDYDLRYTDTDDWCASAVYTTPPGDRDMVIAHANKHVGDRAEANARLIAAAPELLEALQGLGARPWGYCFCRSQRDIDNGHTGECQTAVAAIAKATAEPSP